VANVVSMVVASTVVSLSAVNIPVGNLVAVKYRREFERHEHPLCRRAV